MGPVRQAGVGSVQVGTQFPAAGPGSSVPATITVEAEDVEVDGQPVEFASVVEVGVERRRLVSWSGPSDEIVWPFGGVVQAYIEGDLDTAVKDAIVEVLLDGEVVWSSATPAYTGGV